MYKSTSGILFQGYSYTFGPVANLNHEGKINPFAHALFGRSHFILSGNGTATSNAFTMMFGGGADVKINERFAYRLVQADWVYQHFSNSDLKKDVRLSTGIVVRF